MDDPPSNSDPKPPPPPPPQPQAVPEPEPSFAQGLWELVWPDLSVLTSDNVYAPFSEEGNSIFEMIETSGPLDHFDPYFPAPENSSSEATPAPPVDEPASGGGELLETIDLSVVSNPPYYEGSSSNFQSRNEYDVVSQSLTAAAECSNSHGFSGGSSQAPGDFPEVGADNPDPADQAAPPRDGIFCRDVVSAPLHDKDVIHIKGDDRPFVAHIDTIYPFSSHPHCSVCVALRQIAHANSLDRRTMQIHMTPMGQFHALCWIQPMIRGVLTDPEFLFDHPFENFSMAETFLGDYFTHEDSQNRFLVQDLVSELYLAFRVQSFMDKDESKESEEPMSQEDATGSDSDSGDSFSFSRSTIAEQRRRTGRMRLSHIQKYMHLPLAEAAAKLEVCSTVLKKISRKFGVARWPYRKIKAIERTIAGLKQAKENNTGVPDDNIDFEILRLEEQKQRLIKGRDSRRPSKK